MANMSDPDPDAADIEEDTSGKFGHPITPNSTCPPTISARQIAYCSPRRNPLVPSMGSNVQNRLLSNPVAFPRSIKFKIYKVGDMYTLFHAF